MENKNLIYCGNVYEKTLQIGLTSLNEDQFPEPKAYPLRMAKEGEMVRIVDVRGCNAFLERLTGIGLCIGELLEVIQNRINGKLLIGHKGTRLFLGGGMAHKIEVVNVEGGNT